MGLLLRTLLQISIRIMREISVYYDDFSAFQIRVSVNLHVLSAQVERQQVESF